MPGWSLRLKCETCDVAPLLYGVDYWTVAEAEMAMEEIAEVVVGPWLEAHTGHKATVVRGIE